MDLIASINSAINGFVWGVPMLVLLVGTGILMTLRTRGVQFRKFGYAMKNTIGKIFHKHLTRLTPDSRPDNPRRLQCPAQVVLGHGHNHAYLVFLA